VPIISIGEDTDGIEPSRMLSGKRAKGITCRYVVGWEAGWVLVGQLMRCKVEVDRELLKSTYVQ